MDFNLDESQQAAFDLATQIITDKVDMERLMAIEAGDEWLDRDVWNEFGKAGLIGIAVPEALGGGGLDLVAFGAVLQAQGAGVDPMPLLQSGLAAMTIAEFGSADQQNHLAGLCDGSAIFTLGVQEYLDDRLESPTTVLQDGTVTGEKVVVEFAEAASHILVTVDTGSGTGIALVALDADGISTEAGESTRCQPVHVVKFDGTPGELVGPADGASIPWLLDRLRIGLCATQLGVTEAALKLTAAYTSEREQFGRPIATFQAVTQRLADQFINVEGIRLCSRAAAWKVANGIEASEDVHIAKWYASERATDIANATQHCHGGMGVSIDYPLHRYTLWNKHITTSLGAGTQQLRELGAHLAAG